MKNGTNMEEAINFWGWPVFISIGTAIACAFFGEGDAAIAFAILANVFFNICKFDAQ